MVHSEKLKWTGMAIPFWVRIYVIFHSHEIHFLYWNGIHIFHYTFYFYSRMENPSQQVQNGTSISKRDTHFESVWCTCHIKTWHHDGQPIPKEYPFSGLFLCILLEMTPSLYFNLTIYSFPILMSELNGTTFCHKFESHPCDKIWAKRVSQWFKFNGGVCPTRVFHWCTTQFHVTCRKTFL